MAEVIDIFMEWIGWQTPGTLAILFENLVRVSIGIGLILALFKFIFKLSNIHNII